jgi:DNA helicase HerA-like ATPase
MTACETYVGRVQSATSSELVVVVDPDEDPIKTYEGRTYRVCQVGGYVRLPREGSQIVGVVTEAVQRDVTPVPREAEATTTRRELKVQLVGSLTDGRFARGVILTPCIDDPVHIATRSDMEAIFGSGAQSPVELGTLSAVPELPAFVDGDILCSHHVAVVGGTGSGKSSVVASVLQKATKLPSTQVVLLDLHNEYGAVFGDAALSVRGDCLSLPYWLLNFDEMQDLFVDVREQTAHNQVMLLKDLVVEAKREANPDVSRLSVDSPLYFDLGRVREGFERWNSERVEGERPNTTKQGPFYGQLTRLLARVDSRRADIRYDFMFSASKYSSSETLPQYLSDMLAQGAGDKKIAVVDLSGVPSEILGVVVSVLCRVIFDFQFWLPDPVKRPVLLALEEAHNYVPRSGVGRAQAARASVERISKEGRKYGLGLMLVSQRPSEISDTVLAQCGTFIAMRLTNASDQAYVRHLVPDTLGEIMGALPALERGEAIVSGDAVVLPARVLVAPPDPFPRSQDAKVWTEWSAEKPHLDTQPVVSRWQRQERYTPQG